MRAVRRPNRSCHDRPADDLAGPGDPAASPETRISVLGVTPRRIRSVRAKGATTGVHRGTLRRYPQIEDPAAIAASLDGALERAGAAG